MELAFRSSANEAPVSKKRKLSEGQEAGQETQEIVAAHNKTVKTRNREHQRLIDDNLEKDKTINTQRREIQCLQDDKGKATAAHKDALASCHKTIDTQDAKLARLTLKDEETEKGLTTIRQEPKEADEDKWEIIYKREKELREAALRELPLKLDLAQADSAIDALVRADRERRLAAREA